MLWREYGRRYCIFKVEVIFWFVFLLFQYVCELNRALSYVCFVYSSLTVEFYPKFCYDYFPSFASCICEYYCKVCLREGTKQLYVFPFNWVEVALDVQNVNLILTFSLFLYLPLLTIKEKYLINEWY